MKALEIYPKNSEALDLLAETYLGWAEEERKSGRIDQALVIISEGYNKTGRDKVAQERLELEEQR